MTALRVVLADHHVATCAGVRAALEEAGLEVVATADDAEHAVRAVLDRRPEACLIEVDLPGGGIAAAVTIASQAPGTAVVMLAGSDREADLLEAIRAGARGYLPKGTNADRLAAAVRGAVAGEAAIPRRLVGRLMDAYRVGDDGPGARRRGLTDREWTVLRSLGEGRTTKEVAAELGLSEVTIRRHVSSAVRRLGVAGRQEAIESVQSE